MELFSLLLLTSTIRITLGNKKDDGFCLRYPVRYADPDYRYVLDRYYDKAAVIVDYYGRPLAPGFFIDYHQVISSYSPFREARKVGTPLTSLSICALRNRMTRVIGDKTEYIFNATRHSIRCARQIVPIPEDLMKLNEWHGIDKAHSPLHDIIVFRTPPVKIIFRYDWDIWIRFPVVVNVAEPTAELGREIMFASLGFRDAEHVDNCHTFSSHTFSWYDDVIVDCSLYFPKSWGLFICLKNVEKFYGVGSGALLVYRGAFYGIGSFLFKIANITLLVFTDVRKYHHMLGSACSWYEMFHPKEERYHWGLPEQMYMVRPDNDYDLFTSKRWYGRRHVTSNFTEKKQKQRSARSDRDL